VMKENNGRKA